MAPTTFPKPRRVRTNAMRWRLIRLAISGAWDFTEVWQSGRLVGGSRGQTVVPYDDHRLKVIPNYGLVS